MLSARTEAPPGTVNFHAEPFRPAWWLPGPHAQTIAGRMLRRPPPLPLHRERIETPDGDFLDLDFTTLARSGAPLAVLLHGLEGSSRRGYAINTYRALDAHGVGAVGVNFRSCSGEPNRMRRSYHSGDTDDFRFVLHFLAGRFPGSPLGAIGFSLGGNVLLKFLGEERANAPLVAAVAISVPYDLGACADALADSFMGRFYTRHFLRGLVEKMERKRALIDGHIDFARVRAARTFREFDDAATAPLHGFVDAEDYYCRSSSGPYLPHVRVPVLLLHAEDDPFLPAEAQPVATIRANPWLTGVVTRAGGHVGFVEGQPGVPRFWVERQAARFLADRLRIDSPPLAG
ncbi:MAG: hydrolase [Longimicrobiales bacterium]